MTTKIKALEGRTVHQIQSGQVIVDLCSVVKELVENSLDAGATAIDVRFKGNGLESIEVQDNGVGISIENYETVGESFTVCMAFFALLMLVPALKHYTSKLASYDDLSSLQTFGFRGEALSSLCALSNFHLVTARADDAPKGTRLDFEISGRLKSTQVVASTKGTTVAVENLFANLPVRRRELEKNIKREYAKVLAVLQAYACISTEAKLSVSNVMAKGKKATVFATKSNNGTRDNIANVFGAKVLPGLLTLNLSFELQQSVGTLSQEHLSQYEPESNKQVRIAGHVSRPVFGDGRQTPDRQMFFVNSRPCGLPQVARIFNEVYKTFNISQSPFVFANIIVDTNVYDVNVSPDKRTILLHDQHILLEHLRSSLTSLFEKQDQTVPQTQPSLQKLPSYKRLTVPPEASTAGSVTSIGGQQVGTRQTDADEESNSDFLDISATMVDGRPRPNLIESFVGRDTTERPQKAAALTANAEESHDVLSKDKQTLLRKLGKGAVTETKPDDYDPAREVAVSDALMKGKSIPLLDFNKRIAEQQVHSSDEEAETQASAGGQDDMPSATLPPSKGSTGPVQDAFDRMRPRRHAIEVAEVTIGNTTTIMTLGPTMSKRQQIVQSPLVPEASGTPAMQRFSSSMQSFAAPGTEVTKPHGSQTLVPLEHGADVEDDDNRRTSPIQDDDEIMRPEHNLESNVLAGKSPSETSDAEGLTDSAGSDEEYVDEQNGKARESARVAALIRQAEEAAALPSHDNIKRAHNILKGGGQKDSTAHLVQSVEQTIDRINEQLHKLQMSLEASGNPAASSQPIASPEAPSPEERLSLTVSKEDFGRMGIIGQFNLGFIIALRPSRSLTTSDELFIVDQHASDEKSNFERLQSTTVVQNQRLVHPYPLDLTAIEEEIILEYNSTLLKNGFLVDTDTSGDLPVGQRCRLISLPMSREVTFDLSDLEELIALLAETAPSAHAAMESIPRPRKVRKMFAMRACRSSVMIGKGLSLKQMGKLVRRMGEIDKPWNCPHGRPTMRHLMGLADWEGWKEGVGGTGLHDSENTEGIDWGGWMQRMQVTDEGGLQGGTGLTMEADPESTNESEDEEDRHEDEGRAGREGLDEEQAEDRDEADDDSVDESGEEEVGDVDEESQEDFESDLGSTLRSRFAHGT